MRPSSGSSALSISLILIIPALLLAVHASGADAEPAPGAATREAPPQTGLALNVDGRELPLGLLHAHEELSASGGDLALVFPKWIPGAHAPAGRIDNLVGLRFTSGSDALRWDRDEVDPYRLIVHCPKGATQLGIDLTYIANQADSNSIGVDIAGNPAMALVCWNCCLLYPAGRAVAGIPVDASLTIPPDWQIACQLATVEHHKDRWRFARTSLRDLVDQPLIAGAHLVEEEVDTTGGPPAKVSLVSAAATTVLDPQWALKLGQASKQALELFGRAHYRSYRWLFVSGEGMEGVGLEHANCSLCGFADEAVSGFDKASYDDRNMPVHEYVHSWCGKHVRPAGMATEDFQEPQRLGLLWVYEGLTQYLGEVIGARAGFASDVEFRHQLAFYLHDLAHQRGRAWRSIEDTARSSFLLRDWSKHYHELRRDQDYYIEGMLFWLEADLIIRSESHGARSLDDFVRAFLGAPVEPGALRRYALDDVVAGLEAVQHHDWRALIDSRIIGLRPELDLAFLASAGWKLEYTSGAAGDNVDEDAMLDARQSLGCSFHDGRVGDVVPGMPAERAGLHEGSEVRKVNGVEFNAKNLELYLGNAHGDGVGVVTFTVGNGKLETEVKVSCASGPLHPRLVRIAGPDLLASILRARSEPP
jgi:predicted metalloprotease with PDZ domain